MATVVNIEVDQGSTKTVEYDWIDDSTQLPISLVGYTAKMQVRSAPGSDIVCLQYTDSAGIALGGAAGTITLTISPTDTTVFTTAPEWRRGVYDLFVTRTSDGYVAMVAKGEFTIMPRVTV